MLLRAIVRDRIQHTRVLFVNDNNESLQRQVELRILCEEETYAHAAVCGDRCMFERFKVLCECSIAADMQRVRP